MAQYSVVESGNIGLGQVGSALLDDGESAASLGENSIVALTMLEDTTFTTLTQANASITGTGTSTHGNSVVNTDVFPAGVTVYGRWSAVTVNAGLCVAYLG
tara:strand:- start:722 stop:1024 length:303 start_codon:yes stop_codon:yes gene_type:complete